MPRLDVVVASLWPGEKLDVCIADIRRTIKSPHTLHALDIASGKDAPRTLSAAWNDLAAKGSADLIAFMKTDVLLSPGWDIRLSETLEAFPQVGVAIPAFFGDERPINLIAEGPPTTMKEGEPGISDMAAIADWAEMFTGVIYLYDECNAPFSCAVMPRALWKSLGGFDERFRIFGHDHDFQARMNKDIGQLAASVRSCPVYSRCGMASMESIMRVYSDLGQEYAHLEKTRAALVHAKPWHAMSAAERAQVRQDPVYGKLPLSRYALKMIQRTRANADA